MNHSLAKIKARRAFTLHRTFAWKGMIVFGLYSCRGLIFDHRKAR
jgi:hypothetical protein